MEPHVKKLQQGTVKLVIGGLLIANLLLPCLPVFAEGITVTESAETEVSEGVNQTESGVHMEDESEATLPILLEDDSLQSSVDGEDSNQEEPEQPEGEIETEEEEEISNPDIEKSENINDTDVQNTQEDGSESVRGTEKTEVESSETTITKETDELESVVIPDVRLRALFASNFEMTEDGQAVILQSIREYHGTQVSFSMSAGLADIQNTEGLELLQLLPDGVHVRVLMRFGAGASLKGFENVTVSNFSIVHPALTADTTSLESLNKINFTEGDVNSVRLLQLAGNQRALADMRGLQNSDLEKLDPFFTKLVEAHRSSQNVSISVIDNNLSDFSYFNKFENLSIFATGQVSIAPKWTGVFRGQDAVFNQYVKGISGEFISEPLTTRNSEEEVINHGDGTFTIPNWQPSGTSIYTVTSDNRLWTTWVPDGNNLLQYGGFHFYPTRWYDGTITVKYRDQDGQPIEGVEDQVIYAQNGDAYDVSTEEFLKDIPGYTLDETNLPDNTRGEFLGENLEITYTYKKTPEQIGEVTVQYLDIDGNELQASQTIRGTVGTEYDATTPEYKLTIDGYRLDEDQLPDNATGTISQDEQIVTYVYSKEEATEELGTVTVQYLDETGQALAEEKVLTGKIGADFETQALRIEGYVLDSNVSQESYEGIFTEAPQTITFQYTKIPEIELARVTVQFIDKDTGESLHNPVVLTGNVGETYEVTPVEIEGYTIDSEASNELSGTFTEEEQTLVLQYLKVLDSEEKNDPDKDNEGKEDNGNEEGNSNAPDENGKLPVTGESVHYSLVVLGLAIVGFAFFVGFKKRQAANQK